MESYKHSDNQIHADNQQGRLDPWWIVGFVDGEGCFSISIFKNKTTKLGSQVFPEFVVTQGAKSVVVLEMLQTYFGCGNIYVNRRADNHRENLYRFCVRSLDDISLKIVPFFDNYALLTSKQQDFLVFKEVIGLMKNRSHLTDVGLSKIRELASTSNRRKIRD